MGCLVLIGDGIVLLEAAPFQEFSTKTTFLQEPLTDRLTPVPIPTLTGVSSPCVQFAGQICSELRKVPVNNRVHPWPAARSVPHRELRTLGHDGPFQHPVQCLDNLLRSNDQSSCNDLSGALENTRGQWNPHRGVSDDLPGTCLVLLRKGG